ncbi:MAG: efflux RND transporter permease subunit [Myxococcales bacterium]|nr:MAG: efflux RND transporter permease subunit [Myxococcales bacterium]
MHITELALKFKSTIYVLIAFIALAGIVAYRALPLEAAPDVEIPIILVQTLYPGVAPEDMEKLVTNIIEREVKELKDVKKLTSSSAESASIVQIELESDVDMDDAYQKVRDKVDKAKPDLPHDAEEPVLIEINVSEFPMMLINLSGDYGLAKVKNLSDDVKDRIEQVPGVLGVDLTGGITREIQIYLDPARLEYYKLGVGDVINRIQEEHLTTPAGSLDLGQSKYAVRIPGEYQNVALMEDIVVKAPEGRPIKLRDIGRVVDGFEERTTISRANGVEGVTLRVKKRAGENIVAIADKVREILKEMEPTFPAGTRIAIRQDESKMVKDMVSDLENSIISGLILVIGILFITMGLRNATFVAIAIPLSMLLTFIVLRIFGITLNMVVLFSLILALGMLVDNSIVVVENIYRHVAEGKSRWQAALDATKEVAWPVATSTLTTVMAFVPMVFWPDVMGEFMSYLPKTVIIVLVASLFVALVINPVVAHGFLSTKGSRALVDDSGEARHWLLKGYKAFLIWSLRRPKTMVASSNVLLVLALVAMGLFGAGVELFPTTTPDRAQVSIKAPQGTALATTDEMVKQVEAITVGDDNTEVTVANVGFSGSAFSFGGSPNIAVADLEFKDRHERPRSTWDTITAIRERLKGLIGAEFRVDVEEHGPPTGAPVSVEISGDNYDILNGLARQVKELLQTAPNVVDIKDDYEGGKPEIRIDVDREKAMLRKVNTAVISQAVRTAVNGAEASVLREGDEEYDIVVRYDADYRKSIDDLLNIKVKGEDDVIIPLRDVAHVETTGGLGSINHIDQKRTVLVSAEVSGRSSAEIMPEVVALISAKVPLPAGYSIYYSGESEEQQKAAAFLSEAFFIGVFLILMVLIAQFDSFLQPTIIMGSVVMSLIGVMFGLVLSQDKFSIIMTGMAVISLAGVAVNNAIVLIDYCNILIRQRGMPVFEALVRAGMTRFRPVLLTAITTILGMLPLALGVNIDFKNFAVDFGSSTIEWWGPFARAVIFGLSFTTVLTLIMVPVMYLFQVQMIDWVKTRFGSRFGAASK